MGLAKTPWQGDVWEVLDETLLLHSLFLLYLQNGRFHRNEHCLTKRSLRRFFFFDITRHCVVRKHVCLAMTGRGGDVGTPDLSPTCV